MRGNGKVFLRPNQCRFPAGLFTVKKREAGLASGLSLVTRFIRLHPGARKGGATNLGSLFEPHHEQNLSANPKRTAKSFALIQTKLDKLCSNYFQKDMGSSPHAKIAENLRVRTRLDDARQGRATVFKNGFAQGCFLAVAGRQNPDFARRRNRF